jgi:hypothetical protein
MRKNVTKGLIGTLHKLMVYQDRTLPQLFLSIERCPHERVISLWLNYDYGLKRKGVLITRDTSMEVIEKEYRKLEQGIIEGTVRESTVFW